MDQSVIVNLLKTKVVGKILVGAFFRPNQKLWSTFPSTVTKFPPLRAYGSWLHALARMRPIRMSYFYTSFFRNRPLLELARRLADQKSKSAGLKIAVLGCSIGAEVYSILWTIRAKRRDLKIAVNAVDLSQEALDFAQDGAYPPDPAQFTDAQILAPVTDQELQEMFDGDGNRMRIKPWLKEGIVWRAGDAADPRVLGVGTVQHAAARLEDPVFVSFPREPVPCGQRCRIREAGCVLGPKTYSTSAPVRAAARSRSAPSTCRSSHS
ncbi:MAG: CheR family methyltransferase [Acetobacteraceae bacterium]